MERITQIHKRKVNKMRKLVRPQKKEINCDKTNLFISFWKLLRRGFSKRESLRLMAKNLFKDKTPRDEDDIKNTYLSWKGFCHDVGIELKHIN